MKNNMEITAATENEHSSSVTFPLLSRIDRLEIAMRRLEMKQSSSSSGCSSSANNAFSPSSGLTSEHNQQQLPLGLDLDMALKEVSFKGSLLERIKTLENRLFQLRLRVESDKLEARARQNQILSSCSFPIFMMNQNKGAYKKQVAAPNASMIINSTDSQAGKEEDITSCKENDQEMSMQQNKKNKKSKSENGEHEKMARKKKAMKEAEREKIKTPNWTHFRILGC